MPAFRLVLEEANTVYRLSELLLAEDAEIAYQWRQVMLQAGPDNTANIKLGDSELSGLRYGYLLVPGGEKTWDLFPDYVNTMEKYLFCEEANQELLVELQ